jgi:hypothetical protein
VRDKTHICQTQAVPTLRQNRAEGWATRLRTTTLYLPPRERAARSKYGRFLEAWDLLGVKTQGLTIHASAENDFVLTLIKAKLAEVCGAAVGS